MKNKMKKWLGRNLEGKRKQTDQFVGILLI